MNVFGGMSKGERSRVKIRVRSAMASQAKIEGRFLGGRPPYGYRLADAGPHPNPAKAADGKRLHRLEPDPIAAPVVRRIYREYLAGHGLHAISEGLTRDGIVCPSAHDPERNTHRNAVGWPKSAIAVLLTNPRYTGRQVWNKQRKAEILLDIEDVAAGYETKLNWNEPGTWIWSDNIVHEPLVTTEDFEAVQALRLTRRKTSPLEPLQRMQRTSKRDYLLSKILHCGVCGQKMESTFNHGRPHYRCRYPAEYAEANNIEHPRTVYVREDHIVPHLDKWLCKIFAPHRIEATAKALADAAAGDDDQAILADAAHKELAAADRKLGQYRALLEAGTDPATVAGWIREVEIEKIAINARLRQLAGRAIMTPEVITAIVHTLGDLVKVLAQAAPADKMKIYKELGLRLDYDVNTRTVAVEVKTAGSDIESNADGRVRKVRVRGGIDTITPRTHLTISGNLDLESTASRRR